MRIRFILSAVALGVFAAINAILNTAAPLVSGQAAVRQLDDSNASYIVAKTGMSFTGSGLSLALFLVVLAIIWWRPASKLLGFKSLSVALAASMLLIAQGGPAHAYYDFIEIMPSETAFAIPEQGAWDRDFVDDMIKRVGKYGVDILVTGKQWEQLQRMREQHL
jgi:ABC-type polysaccharide/polyol phosphate export permease